MGTPEGGDVYRCGACRFATFDTGTMKNHAMEHYSTPPEKVITNDPLGSAADSPADGSALRPAKSSGAAGGGGSVLSRNVSTSVRRLTVRRRTRRWVERVDADADAVRSTVASLKEKGEIV